MRPDLDGPTAARVAAVLLHPHPHFGGDRFHPLIDGCYRQLVSRGHGAVRFDFSSADPETACSEAQSAIEVAREQWPDAMVVLVGYSFGASMAVRIADDAVAGWFLVAPPEVTIGDAMIADDPRPKRVLVPEHDQFSSAGGIADATSAWLATEVQVIAGDHYLFGTLSAVIAECLRFVDTFEQGPSAPTT